MKSKILLFIVMLTYFAYSALWYVDPDIGTSGNGTSPAEAFNSVESTQVASYAVSPNDSVLCKVGTYAIERRIPMSTNSGTATTGRITYISASGVDWLHYPDSFFVVDSGFGSWTVSYIRMIGIEVRGTLEHGIDLSSGGDNNEIYNCKIDSSGGWGIYSNNQSVNNIIDFNLFNGNTSGSINGIGQESSITRNWVSFEGGPFIGAAFGNAVTVSNNYIIRVANSVTVITIDAGWKVNNNDIVGTYATGVTGITCSAPANVHDYTVTENAIVDVTTGFNGNGSTGVLERNYFGGCTNDTINTSFMSIRQGTPDSNYFAQTSDIYVDTGAGNWNHNSTFAARDSIIRRMTP